MTKSVYDLEGRTAKFGEDVIGFVKTLPQNIVTKPLVSQVTRSSTSIGANYCEADNAESKKDFKHKISLCKKESRETMHWLRMIAKALPNHKAGIKTLWQEAKELNLIFSKIIHSTAQKK